MAEVPLLTKRRDGSRGGDRELIGHVIGNALVVHPRSALRNEIRDLALTLAEDPEHELVVVDLPPDSSMAVWEAAARLLPRKRRGLRLVVGGRTRETTALAGQWLSERLGRTVVAPDGDVLPGVGGSLFVDSGWGTGWMRFQPGREPTRDGKRFPRPTWEEVSSLVEVMPTSAIGVAEPLPGGVWLRPRGPEHVLRPHRQLLVDSLPSQPDVCVVVLGCPGTQPITTHDVARFWGWLPAGLRGRLRLIAFGPFTTPGDVPRGQAIADALGEGVTCYTGLPLGSRTEPDVFTVRPDGALGWRALAEQVAYLPAEPGRPAPPPSLISHRTPFVGVDEIAPAVYRYSADVVLEVVQSGLWLRPPHEVGHAAAVRSAVPDATRHLVLFEEGHRHVRELAEDVFDRLDPATRALSALVRADSVVRRRIEVVGGALGTVEEGTAVAVVPATADDPVAHPVLTREGPLSIEASTMRLESAWPDAPSPTPVTAPGEPPAVPLPLGPLPHGALPLGSLPDSPLPGGSPAVPPLAGPPLAGPPAGSPPAGSPLVGPSTAGPPLAVPSPAGPSAAVPPAGWSPTGPSPAASPPAGPSTAVPQPAVPQPSVPVVEEAFPPAAFDLPAVDAPETTLPTAAPPAGPHSAPQPAPPSTTPRTTPTQPEPPSAAPTSPAPTSAVPTSATPTSVVQPTPDLAAAALVPTRGLEEERAWLRRTLSREYAAVANSVTRVLSEHPGFQGALERSSGEVLTDAVAIRLYLSGEGDGLDLPLRTGAVGPHVPFARCVVSGLSRLPSHRGATVFATSPTPREWELYRGRKFFTEWGFVNALTAPCARQRQEHQVDVVLWSMTARRTKLLEPESDPTTDRVLFVPGTSFKVLDLVEPRPGERGLLMLRELSATEIDPSGRVDGNRASLDELAVNSLRRQLDTWAATAAQVRVPEAAAHRFAALPGLVRTAPTPEEGR
ncbi:hypothetical protein ACIGNX_01810 [Actinosynnema sp. NPDC053489]|uniref:hypothetical protein n=1 Tax=Actinosynnema sp. NPDC053489 TaxID=3363916 RepID=UPI0037C8E024